MKKESTEVKNWHKLTALFPGNCPLQLCKTLLQDSSDLAVRKAQFSQPTLLVHGSVATKNSNNLQSTK
jgi:hypothetical protein